MSNMKNFLFDIEECIENTSSLEDALEVARKTFPESQQEYAEECITDILRWMSAPHNALIGDD